MSSLHVKDQAQAYGIEGLVRWFDNNSSSVHHALIMAAERNESDAEDPEVQKFPAVVETLIQSAKRWRMHADEVLIHADKIGDPDDIHTRQ